MRPSALPDGDPVSFGLDGAPMPIAGMPGGPPLLVVEPITDTLKVVTGDRIVGSVDKETVLGVVGFVLSREVISALGGDDYSPEALVARVTELGYEWQVSP